MMRSSPLKALVAALVVANVGVWALTNRPVAAVEASATVETRKQCWYTPYTMGCSEWFQQGCVDVSDC
jgi:hypothetical protein